MSGTPTQLRAIAKMLLGARGREWGDDLREAADAIDAERALADDLAAFIAKPVRVHPVTLDGFAYSVKFSDEWKAERDALLARYREARQLNQGEPS